MQRPISSLNLPETKIKELRNKGYNFCDDINLAKIQSEVGISSQNWLKLVANVETQTALDICQHESEIGNIVTLSRELDQMLGGGIPLGCLTEFCGLPGSGKTQICLQLSVAVQMPDVFGGLNAQAIYLDSNFGLTAKRLNELANGCVQQCHQVANSLNSFEMLEALKHFSALDILNGIYHLQISKFIDLLASLNSIKNLIDSNQKIKLIVIDNISHIVKQSNLSYISRTKVLLNFLTELRNLASSKEISIILANNLTTKINEFNVSYETPSLGDSFAQCVNNRVTLERNPEGLFKATVVKNFRMPPASVFFQINNSGIGDVS